MDEEYAGKRDEVDQKVAYLMENNQRAVKVLRDQAKAFGQIAEFYISQANNALEIEQDIAAMALIASRITGDIIIGEFGVDMNQDEEDEDGRPDDSV